MNLKNKTQLERLKQERFQIWIQKVNNLCFDKIVYSKSFDWKK